MQRRVYKEMWLLNQYAYNALKRLHKHKIFHTKHSGFIGPNQRVTIIYFYSKDDYHKYLRVC
jgi:hypothetical protein